MPHGLQAHPKLASFWQIAQDVSLRHWPHHEGIELKELWDSSDATIRPSMLLTDSVLSVPCVRSARGWPTAMWPRRNLWLPPILYRSLRMVGGAASAGANILISSASSPAMAATARQAGRNKSWEWSARPIVKPPLKPSYTLDQVAKKQEERPALVLSPLALGGSELRQLPMPCAT